MITPITLWSTSALERSMPQATWRVQCTMAVCLSLHCDVPTLLCSCMLRKTGSHSTSANAVQISTPTNQPILTKQRTRHQTSRRVCAWSGFVQFILACVHVDITSRRNNAWTHSHAAQRTLLNCPPLSHNNFVITSLSLPHLWKNIRPKLTCLFLRIPPAVGNNDDQRLITVRFVSFQQSHWRCISRTTAPLYPFYLESTPETSV